MTGRRFPKPPELIEGKDLRPCHARCSPTDRIRGHIDELFAQDKGLPEILEDVLAWARSC